MTPALAPFHIEVAPDRERVAVAPRGELDLATVAPLREQIGELLDAGFEHLVLDLRGVAFVDSTGLRLILELTGREGLDFVVIPGPQPVQRMFEVAGVSDLLPFTSAFKLTAR